MKYASFGYNTKEKVIEQGQTFLTYIYIIISFEYKFKIMKIRLKNPEWPYKGSALGMFCGVNILKSIFFYMETTGISEN